jgi:hypothetical protein
VSTLGQSTFSLKILVRLESSTAFQLPTLARCNARLFLRSSASSLYTLRSCSHHYAHALEIHMRDAGGAVVETSVARLASGSADSMPSFRSHKGKRNKAKMKTNLAVIVL